MSLSGLAKPFKLFKNDEKENLSDIHQIIFPLAPILERNIKQKRKIWQVDIIKSNNKVHHIY